MRFEGENEFLARAGRGGNLGKGPVGTEAHVSGKLQGSWCAGDQMPMP